MWSTFLVTDEEGRTVGPPAVATVGLPPQVGPAQGPANLASLMSGRSTFGGNKRRRTTTTGHSMSEAQEGKVTAFILCECVFSLRLYESTGANGTNQSHSHLFNSNRAGPQDRKHSKRANEGLYMLSFQRSKCSSLTSRRQNII